MADPFADRSKPRTDPGHAPRTMTREQLQAWCDDRNAVRLQAGWKEFYIVVGRKQPDGTVKLETACLTGLAADEARAKAGR